MSSPHDQHYTFVHRSGWDGPGFDWQPGSVSDDPHDCPFDVIDAHDLDASKVDGDIPPNIVT